MTPQETEPKLSAGVGGSPVEVWFSMGSPQGCGHRQQKSGKVPLGVNHRAHRPEDWVTSGQKSTREGVQPHPSADNWMKVLLNKALPTRGRPSFSHHQSLASGNLHKLLNLLHQRADRRSKKKHSPTEIKTKTTLHKVMSQMKGKDENPRKTAK